MNRNEIDEIFGSEATDENLIIMGRTWTIEDMQDYVETTGYEGDAAELLDWLRKFASRNTAMHNGITYSIVDQAQLTNRVYQGSENEEEFTATVIAPDGSEHLAFWQFDAIESEPENYDWSNITFLR